MKELNLTQGNVPKVLLQFAVPFLIANILQALYGGADLFVDMKLKLSAAHW